MFEGFRPEVVKKNVRDVDLADLNHAHGDNAGEDEPAHIDIEFKEGGQKSYREETDDRPESDLKETEDVALRDDPILKDEGPYPNQSVWQIR